MGRCAGQIGIRTPKPGRDQVVGLLEDPVVVCSELLGDPGESHAVAQYGRGGWRSLLGGRANCGDAARIVIGLHVEQQLEVVAGKPIADDHGRAVSQSLRAVSALESLLAAGVASPLALRT